MEAEAEAEAGVEVEAEAEAEAEAQVEADDEAAAEAQVEADDEIAAEAEAAAALEEAGSPALRPARPPRSVRLLTRTTLRNESPELRTAMLTRAARGLADVRGHRRPAGGRPGVHRLPARLDPVG